MMKVLEIDNLILKTYLPTFRLDAPVLLKARLVPYAYSEKIWQFFKCSCSDSTNLLLHYTEAEKGTFLNLGLLLIEFDLDVGDYR